ncbi:hypothetical protein ACJ72_05536 [Emergomyces africanus]|uniref:Thioesterase domain-containing protein n=1 Tax=Emergomyces africanus TaxID=1955775 RepID=A0A1B7NTM1_9EURO|nr:hypothetical protein ACJ72_05536 [Emergomyces africanus]
MDSILKKQINLTQISPESFEISWDVDWTVGPTLHGGCIAAAIHHAATTYLATNPTLAARNQPDVLQQHLEFLRPCEHRRSTITITPLKIGALASTLQLQLTQGQKLKVLALVTSTNFEHNLGPSAPTSWSFQPAPPPIPDFDRVLAQQPEEHWMSCRVTGEIVPLTRRKPCLISRAGLPVDGICDVWHRFLGNERMDATYLALLADCCPSMSDTLLRNEGPYDAHTFLRQVGEWDRKNPGVPCEMSNSIADAMQSTHFDVTLTLDIEYKKRLPQEGERFVFARTLTKKFQGGRLDLDITLCNENMELLASAQQVILALDTQRKFGSSGEKASL